MDILNRNTWGAASPSSPLVPFTNSRLTHIVAHWPGDPRNLAPLNSADLLRRWQKYHMVTRGWRDIGYNYAVDQAGNVYEARGWHVGGHVLGAQNSISVGILLMVGNNEEPTDRLLDSGHQLVTWIEDRRGRELERIGHCDWANKLCPGPDILSWVRGGCKPATIPLSVVTPTPKPVPVVVPTKRGETSQAPTFPLPAGAYFGPRSGPVNSVSGYHGHRADLDRWQTRMGYRGWRITPDGLYGPETARVARAFQAEKHLAVDGLIGPKTWAAAWTEPIT